MHPHPLPNSRPDAVVGGSRPTPAQGGHAPGRVEPLGALATVLAHEVNNLLTPVLSYAQLALASPDDRELALQALHKVAAGVLRVSEAVDSVLELGRSGAAADAGATASVAGCASEAAESLAASPTGVGVEVSVRAPAGLDAAMRSSLLHQVLLNLMLNAARAMSPAGGRIVIEACSTGNNRIQITLRDTGPGVPRALAARIFDPHVSGPSADLRIGLGLGLAICRGLVESVGGRIWLENAGDPGACFGIDLPIAAAA